MPLPNPNEKTIATGAFVSVFATQNGKRSQLGLVNNASFNEDFNNQEANVIGFYGPITIDSMNYRCSITIGNYVPAKKKSGESEAFLDGGSLTLSDVIKTRTDIALDGIGTVMELVEFVDKQSGEVINSFKYVVISSNSGQINPTSYVTSNVQMMSIERLK